MGHARVVVVGAGFGGLKAVRALRHAPVEVTLVDRHNFHTFQPLLYQVATAGLDPGDVAHNARAIVRAQPNADFRLGSVTDVDLDRRLVCLDVGDPLPYDALILAAGGRTNTFGVPGVGRHAFALKSLADATALRNQVLGCFEAVDRDPTLLDAGALTFVVAGGGPTGVEVAGALAELVDRVLARDYPDARSRRARIVLVEMMDRLLNGFTEASGTEACRALQARGVELRLGTSITEVTADEVRVADGAPLATRTLVWAAGIQANGLAERLGVQQGSGGRVPVRPNLSLPGRPEVFVIGDLAVLKGPGGRPYPQLAPVAQQQGAHAAGEIQRRMRGEPPRPFSYFDRGTMATIGRRSAVAELPFGIRYGGTLAWLSWLGLHLLTLLGFRNRLVVLVKWAWNYLTYDAGARLIFLPPARAAESAEPPASSASARRLQDPGGWGS